MIIIYYQMNELSYFINYALINIFPNCQSNVFSLRPFLIQEQICFISRYFLDKYYIYSY